MNKKNIFFKLIVLGSLSFMLGYCIYGFSKQPESLKENPERQIEIIQKEQQAEELEAEQYYLLKSNDRLLYIYQMPEGLVYDSVSLDSLYLPDNEEIFKEGLVFKTLKEVFEFLENSMS